METLYTAHACALCRAPPCCTYPLPLNCLKAGREEGQKRKRGKGDGLIAFIKSKKEKKTEVRSLADSLKKRDRKSNRRIIKARVESR